MIYTLTTNPAVDMNISSNGLKPNCVTRTKDAVYTPNGKGLNVSFTLDHWGIKSTILGFFGGFSGNYIVEEASKVCPVEPVMIDGITRVNVFLNTGEDEYVLPNAGAEVSRQKQLEMLDMLKSFDDMECLIISGSLSPNIDDSFYDEVIDIVKEKGAEFILDISHPCLKRLVERGPLLIKPNETELLNIFDLDVLGKSEDVVLSAMSQINKLGAKNILLTLGCDGAYFYNGNEMYYANSAKVELLSSACAGDATLASFLSIWMNDKSNIERALKRAMSSGANVAMSAGLGDFSLVEKFEKEIKPQLIEH